MASGWDDLSDLGKFGVIMQGFGAVSGGVASFYKTSAEEYKTKSLGLSLEHKKDMTLFNVRMKDSQAEHIARTFDKQYQIMTLKQGGRKSTARTKFAARGIQLGVGSTLNAFVTSEVMAEIDKGTMNSNKVRAIQNKKLEAVGLGIKGDMYGLSASNMFATASSIDPFLNMQSSLLTGGANFISSLPQGMLRKPKDNNNNNNNNNNNS